MADPDSLHEQYVEFLPVWQKCRDAREGQRAIRKGGVKYLPSLIGQETAEYNKYRDRANFFNATGRTVEAMSGLVFRKPMTWEVPAAVEPWLEDITLSGETLTDFAETCVVETITVARDAILVDMPRVANDLTRAQAEAQQIRPYLSLYKTESILNWEMGRVNNVYQYVNVWLAETYKNQKGEIAEQIRQLRLDGIYFQDIWQKADNGEWFVSETIVPVKNGANITEIPFYPISPRKTTLEVTAPPIESLADVNIAHYQNSADLENGAHIAGQPTPYATGLQDDESGPIYIGSSTFLTFSNENTKVGFLQCGSEGFATLEKLMDRKEQQMAALGARMLAPEKKDAEAAQTHEIKRGGESSILSSTCGVIERQIEKALRFAAEWQGITGEISVELNRDFFPPSFTGSDLTAWVAARQAGEISKETLFNVLKYSEWLPDERTFEEEQDAIAADGPTLGELTDKP
jgi:hypothetical protein